MEAIADLVFSERAAFETRCFIRGNYQGLTTVWIDRIIFNGIREYNDGDTTYTPHGAIARQVWLKYKELVGVSS